MESYVYRLQNGELAIPGEYLRGAIINAAKFKQDPRSPRKSAMDLFKAAIVPTTPLASLGKDKWDYEHIAPVNVQKAKITRTRPALFAGWKAQIDMLVLLPEYVPPQLLHGVLTDAGRLIGVGDFRPTYGRFLVEKFEVVDLE